MTSKQNLKTLAKQMLKDAKILLQNRRISGAMYLSGYSLELALKYKICKTMKWSIFPPNLSDYKSFTTHKLDILLNLSGVSLQIK